MASGQSNMQWLASKCDVGMVLQKQIDARVAAGEEKPPVIRETKVTDFFACLHPIEHATGEWHADAGNMSAIAYAFAYHLHREIGVPVGILNCSFSQTSIQAWIPREGFAAGTDEYTKAILSKSRRDRSRHPGAQGGMGRSSIRILKPPSPKTRRAWRGARRPRKSPPRPPATSMTTATPPGCSTRA